MAIQITCSACNVRLSLGDDRAGDRFECPQCDATIKVPHPEGQSAPKPAPAPKPTAKPAPTTRAVEPDSDDEPRGPDKRVIVGIAAGVMALLVVGAAVVLFAVRKPQEKAVAKADDPLPPAVVKPFEPLPVPKKAPPADVTPPKPIDNAPPVLTPLVVDPPIDDSGKQFTTSFLGSQGKGQRFCIIADNSGSMGGPKLADLKTQMLKTLDEMNANAEFYIYFFNSVSEPMPHATWLKPGAAETDKVKKWVKDTPSRGGTNPLPSFEAALKLDPKPDVIFLMTDGQFSPNIPPRMADLNGTPPKSVVNTILFEPRFGGPMPKLPPGVPVPMPPVPPKGAVTFAENQLRQIAEKGGGTFTRYSPP